ncbi:hypothetical protein EMCRGX_G034171 [Ephydatia muelleri]
MEEKGRGVEDYGRQIRAILAFAVFGGLVALGTVATGLWFVLYVRNFVVIVEDYMRNVFWGYAALGVYLLLSVIVVIYGAHRNDRRILLACLVLLLGLLVCEADLWVFIYLQKENISAAIRSNLRLYACTECAVALYVDQTFTCSIATATLQDGDLAYVNCSSRIEHWFSVVVWAVLGFGVGRIALEGLLLILVLMLRYVLLQTPKENQVAPESSHMEIASRKQYCSAANVVEEGVAGQYVTMVRHKSDIS